MFEIIRNWLNSKDKNYFKGVLIYEQCGDNKKLLVLFKKDRTPWCEKRLLEELQRCYDQLKLTISPTPIIAKLPAVQVQINRDPVEKIPNAELYNTCRTAALNQYKEAMNMRANLFALARVEEFEDPNDPGSVAARSSLSIEVVMAFNKASKLFDDADFVKIHGYLPNQYPDQEEDNNMNTIPDALVKQTLDNLRKNFNKIKKREQTPERVALLQKHAGNIKLLEEKWNLLKPKL